MSSPFYDLTSQEYILFMLIFKGTWSSNLNRKVLSLNSEYLFIFLIRSHSLFYWVLNRFAINNSLTYILAVIWKKINLLNYLSNNEKSLLCPNIDIKHLAFGFTYAKIIN